MSCLKKPPFPILGEGWFFLAKHDISRNVISGMYHVFEGIYGSVFLFAQS